MEFFGLTLYGASDPIKFLMRPDYKEPDYPPNMIEIIKKGEHKHSLAEILREVDVYSGFLDGFAYRSLHRLCVTKNRGFYKPVGPTDIYRDSISQSMDYGWFLSDPELKGQTWYKNEYFMPKPTSEETKFLNNALLKDKNVVL